MCLLIGPHPPATQRSPDQNLHRKTVFSRIKTVVIFSVLSQLQRLTRKKGGRRKEPQRTEKSEPTDTGSRQTRIRAGFAVKALPAALCTHSLPQPFGPQFPRPRQLRSMNLLLLFFLTQQSHFRSRFCVRTVVFTIPEAWGTPRSCLML